MEIAMLATGILVFIAHILDAVFQKTGIPDIILLMVLGVVLGPVTGLVPAEATEMIGGFLSIATLIVILTESGLSLEIQAIIRSAARSLPFSILAFTGSVALIAVLCHVLLGLDWWLAIMGGATMGGTSASVVIPILKSVGAGEQTSTILTIESALTDVLCIIGAVGIATALVGDGAVQTGGLLGGAALSLLSAIAYGGFLGVGWSVFLAGVERLRSSMFVTLAFALVVYGTAEIMGASGAIAALAFGVALGNVPEGTTVKVRFWRREAPGEASERIRIKHVTQAERRLYAEVVFLLKAFFFIYLGTTLRIESFGGDLALVAALLAGVAVLPRYPVILATMKRDLTPRREALLAVALGPRGMAAAVLAQLPVQMGVPGTADLAEVVTMMVFFSITLSAVLVFLIERGWLNGLGRLLFWGFPERVIGPPRWVDADDGGDEGSDAPPPVAAEEPASIPDAPTGKPDTRRARMLRRRATLQTTAPPDNDD